MVKSQFLTKWGNTMGNLHLVTGYAGEAHVASSDQGSLFEALIRSGQFVMDAGAKFAASIVSNNQIRVNDGELMMQGRHVKLIPGAYVDLTIENGTQGYLRNDLVVARYTKNADTGIEECSLVVIKGTPAETNPSDPEYTTGIINADGALQHDYPLYKVTLSGLSIEGLTALFEPEKSLFDYVKDNFAPSGFGLGGISKNITSLARLNSLTDNCWYLYASLDEPIVISGVDFPYGYGRVDNYDGTRAKQTFTPVPGYVSTLERYMENNIWGEWEWVNPPMVAGTEYRTTERYKGSAIYKKVNSNGDILWRKDGETQWHLLSSASYVAAATVE